MYTFAVYVGSSIYTSSQQSVIEIFGVSHAEGALGLALYVLVSYILIKLQAYTNKSIGIWTRLPPILPCIRDIFYRPQSPLCHLWPSLHPPVYPNSPRQ
jgi:hypothetical protein